MVTKIFRMHFLPGSVELYSEVKRVNGTRGLWHVASLRDVAAARELARSITPDGWRVRLLVLQRHQLREVVAE